MTDPYTNPINYIQELCQKHSFAFPVYKEVDFKGSPHCRIFSISCSFEGYVTTGTGTDKKSAKKESAMQMLYLTNNGASLLNKSQANNSSGDVSMLRKTNFDELDGKIIPPTNNVEVNNFNCVSNLKNPISLLLEYCQEKKIILPSFDFSNKSEQGFLCECVLNDLKTYGKGPVKQSAKTESARLMCEKLNLLPQSTGLLERSDKDESNSEVGSPKNDVEVNKFKHENSLKNPTSLLMEYCQGKRIQFPVYLDSNISGDFICECILNDIKTCAKGTSKKSAKTESSRLMCEKLNILPKSMEVETTLQETISEKTTPTSRKTDVVNQLLKELILDSDDEPAVAEDNGVAKDTRINSELENQDDTVQISFGEDPNDDQMMSTSMVDSLILDDSVVEIEPRSDNHVTGQEEIKNNETIGSLFNKPLLKESEKNKKPSSPEQSCTGFHGQKESTSETLKKWVQKPPNLP